METLYLCGVCKILQTLQDSLLATARHTGLVEAPKKWQTPSPRIVCGRAAIRENIVPPHIAATTASARLFVAPPPCSFSKKDRRIRKSGGPLQGASTPC